MIENDIQTLQKIKKTHERVAVIAGVIMGVTMSVYFFTFSMLIDHGDAFALWFEIITAVLFLFGLIFLKRLAFFITRIVLGMNADCRRAFKGLKVVDLEKVQQ
jgi:multidrug transporter EmrE-like cation transporter